MPSISAHMLTQNEDQFVWYAIKSVIYFVNEILITDNGSTDQTLDLVHSFNSPKIKLTQLLPTDREGLISRRQQQLADTTSDWILLLDGDEIWPAENLQILVKEINSVPDEIFGLVCRTRNCVGDIYHFQDDSAGRYTLLGRTGHYTIRAIRNHPELKLEGQYPNEAFCINNIKLQDMDSYLKFIDTWYLHTTHLPRSSNRLGEQSVVDRTKKLKLESGILLTQAELPEVFNLNNIPDFVPRPQNVHLSGLKKISANAITLAKKIKRSF